MWNPINFNDPTGHCIFSAYGQCIIADNGQHVDYSAPDTADESQLTEPDGSQYGGQDAYNLYLKLWKHKSGWWWKRGHFTLEDFFALVFFREGWDVLANSGYKIQNQITLIDAFSEGAVRSMYGWCNDVSSGGACMGGPDSIEGKLNWIVRYSQSLTNTFTALTSGNQGSDLDSLFAQRGLSPTNANTVAYNFMNSDPSWRVAAPMSSGRPYGWGNDLSGRWLADNVNLSEMVVWASSSFFIPTYEGNVSFNAYNPK